MNKNLKESLNLIIINCFRSLLLLIAFGSLALLIYSFSGLWSIVRHSRVAKHVLTARPATAPSATNTNLSPQTGSETHRETSGSLGYLKVFRLPDGSQIPATNWTIIKKDLVLFEQQTGREVISIAPETGMLDGKVTTVGIYFVHKLRAESVPKKDPLWRPNPNAEVK